MAKELRNLGSSKIMEEVGPAQSLSTPQLATIQMPDKSLLGMLGPELHAWLTAGSSLEGQGDLCPHCSVMCLPGEQSGQQGGRL